MQYFVLVQYPRTSSDDLLKSTQTSCPSVLVALGVPVGEHPFLPYGLWPCGLSSLCPARLFAKAFGFLGSHFFCAFCPWRPCGLTSLRPPWVFRLQTYCAQQFGRQRLNDRRERGVERRRSWRRRQEEWERKKEGEGNGKRGRRRKQRREGGEEGEAEAEAEQEE